MIKLGGFVRKNTATIGLVIIGLCIGLMFFVQSLALSKLESDLNQQQHIISQIKTLASQSDDHAADRTAQINQLNRHMDCIVLFFSQPDRTSKSIADIDKCTLIDARTGVTSPNLLGDNGVLSPDQSQDSTASPMPTNGNPSTTPSPAPAAKPTNNTASPASQAPSAVQRNVIQPIKNVLNSIF